MKNDKQKRKGFHSIEIMLKHNPHKIKKIFLPHSRKDTRINNLIALAEEHGVNYEFSRKLKKDPEASISDEKTLNFKDLKIFLTVVCKFLVISNVVFLLTYFLKKFVCLPII